jgi:tRNA uridine 5-carboxymethylaminomethyl modification enzyme
MEALLKKKKEMDEILTIMKTTKLSNEEANTFLELKGDTSSVTQKINAGQLLLRPGIQLKNMIEGISILKNKLSGYDPESIHQAEIQIKYAVYLEKEEEMVLKMSSLENQVIPDSFKYENIVSLSNEARQKFIKIKPQTLGQASRISGVNPSDVQILMVYMGR